MGERRGRRTRITTPFRVDNRAVNTCQIEDYVQNRTPERLQGRNPDLKNRGNVVRYISALPRFAMRILSTPASVGVRALLGLLAIGLAVGMFGSSLAHASPTPEQIAFFEKKIWPVLAEHCYQCHSADALRAGKLKASLLVDSRGGMAKGGESGAAVVPGNKDESLLLAALQYDGFEMPPAGKLPDEVIADFETWIEMGAPDPRDEPLATIDDRTIDVEEGRKHWSYRRLSPVSPPEVKTTGWAKNDIDRFILAKQEEVGIAPASEAAKATLARRLRRDGRHRISGGGPVSWAGDRQDSRGDSLRPTRRHGGHAWLERARHDDRLRPLPRSQIRFDRSP